MPRVRCFPAISMTENMELPGADKGRDLAVVTRLWRECRSELQGIEVLIPRQFPTLTDHFGCEVSDHPP
jgi:hypothetical protein